MHSNPRPIWLIEASVYGTELQPLLAAIRRQGFVSQLLPYTAVRTGAVPIVAGQPLADSACVIAYGTYPFAQQVLLHHPWKPGAWCSAERLDCATYYPHFGAYLLNQAHALLPGIEALRQQDQIFATFGRTERVFVRPSSCHKLFIGRCVERSAFAAALAPTRYDPDTMVVVAAPQPTEREWRLVVVDDRVIAGTQYAQAGERAIVADCPAEVRQYAEEVLARVRWRPDPVFMLDVAESAGRLWLVELNSFSGSWLYECDHDAVVAAVSERARLSRGSP